MRLWLHTSETNTQPSYYLPTIFMLLRVWDYAVECRRQLACITFIYFYAFVQQLLKPKFSYGISLRPHGSERPLASTHLSVRMGQSDYNPEDFF